MNSEQNNVVMVTQWPTKGISEILGIKPDVDLIVALDALTKAFIQQQERTKRLEETLMEAWGIIANVSDGDWTRQKPHWQEAVVKWRDNQFHPSIKELSELKAKEAKS